VLGDVKLMYSPNKNFEVGRSQTFHLDGEDYRQVKVFIHLTDVDANTGPLTILDATNSRKVYAGIRRGRTPKHADETIFSFTDEHSAIQLCGPKGTIAFVDTCQCYHFGSRPSSRPRLLLQLQYFTPFSIEMPIYGRHAQEFNFVAGNHADTDFDLVPLVLGLGHLNYAILRQKAQQERRRLVKTRETAF
jgi:hypothetical protein